MGKGKDISGQRFGRLVAIRPDHVDEKRRTCYLFRCDCGNEKVMPAAAVKFHRVRSCGCLYLEHASNLNKQDIAGQRFDRLTAVHPTEDRDASGSIVWECLCDCGNTAYHSVNALNSGNVHMTPAAQRKFLENLDYQLPVEFNASDHNAEDPET